MNKQTIIIIIFISIIIQVNIAINDGIKLAVAKHKESKISKEKMLCPSDIYTKNEGKTDYKTPVKFEIIELPPLPEVHQK